MKASVYPLGQLQLYTDVLRPPPPLPRHSDPGAHLEPTLTLVRSQSNASPPLSSHLPFDPATSVSWVQYTKPNVNSNPKLPLHSLL